MAVSIVAPPGTGTPNTVPRAALVTGAGKRIGRGIALGMARAGWDVAVHFGRSSADADETVRQVQALGRRAQAFGADLESESQTRSMFEAAAAAFPALSCVVNNASRFEPDTPATFSFAALDHHLRPNLAAPVLLAQLLHARLAPAHASPPAPEHPPVAGVVINLLDQKLDNPNPDFFSYTLTKAGLLAATHIMAMAFAPVLRVAGVLKRADPELPEEAVLMRALRDFNTPKIPAQDIPIFMRLIADLFPGMELAPKGNAELHRVCAEVCRMPSRGRYPS